MKQSLLATILLILCTTATHAQSDSLFTDSTLEVSFETIIDSCFKHVDLGQVPTGILIEKAMPTTNVFQFNGVENDSNQVNLFLWRKAFGTLTRAHVDTALAHDTLTLQHLVDTMQTYLDSGQVPIAILNYRYSCIKDSAFADSLLRMDGIEIYDVDGRGAPKAHMKTIPALWLLPVCWAHEIPWCSLFFRNTCM
jgi:hypothetical protein